MLIRASRASDVRASEITDERLYLRRREFIGATGRGRPRGDRRAVRAELPERMTVDARRQTPLSGIKPKVVTTDEPLNSFEDITSYNNFYEFGTGKGRSAALRRADEDEPVDA